MLVRNRFGWTNIFKNENYFKNKTIALSMSGGVDSTMLCFLAAKKINKAGLNSTIQPYNGFDSWAPNDSEGLPEIIDHIRGHFPNVKINDPAFCRFDTKGDQVNHKNTYINPFIESLRDNGKIDIIVNGISLGPPLEVQETFGINLPTMRRPGHKSYDEIDRADHTHSPFMHVDKRFIVECYKKFRCKDLLDLTHSCTHPRVSKCGECWWCKERAWAVESVFTK